MLKRTGSSCFRVSPPPHPFYVLGIKFDKGLAFPDGGFKLPILEFNDDQLMPIKRPN